MISNVKTCIREFIKPTQNRLITVPIYYQHELKDEVQLFCETQGIFCMSSNNVQKAENQFNGFGHLKERGNHEHSVLLANAFNVYMKKRK